MRSPYFYVDVCFGQLSCQIPMHDELAEWPNIGHYLSDQAATLQLSSIKQK